MPHLNILRTVHCPVAAVGKEIRNSFGVTIARTDDTFTASAMATLINYGVPAAAADEAELTERERASARILVARLATEGNDRARLEGERAGTNGEDEDRNPYSSTASPDRAASWRSGWKEGCKAHSEKAMKQTDDETRRHHEWRNRD